MNYGEIHRLLSEKREKFLDIEVATEPMQYSEVEVILECMQKRESLLKDITEIDEKINILIGGDEKVKEALSNHCERQQLSPELKQLYDASLAVKAVVNRILQNEEGVRMHMEEEKVRIREAIEKIGQSGSSVAGQYYNAVRMDSSREIEKKM